MGADDDFGRIAIVDIPAWRRDAAELWEHIRGRSRGRPAGWSRRVRRNFTRCTAPNARACCRTQIGHCLHHRVRLVANLPSCGTATRIIITLLILRKVDLVGIITYNKFMLSWVDRRQCRRLRSSKIAGIAGCGGWRRRTGRKAISAIRIAVAICLWGVATGAGS